MRLVFFSVISHNFFANLTDFLWKLIYKAVGICYNKV